MGTHGGPLGSRSLGMKPKKQRPWDPSLQKSSPHAAPHAPNCDTELSHWAGPPRASEVPRKLLILLDGGPPLCPQLAPPPPALLAGPLSTSVTFPCALSIFNQGPREPCFRTAGVSDGVSEPPAKVGA